MNKKALIVIGLAAAVTFVVSGCKTPEQIAQTTSPTVSKHELVIKQDKTEDLNLITISGSGMVKALPDRATVTLSVVSNAPEAAQAEAANSELMTSVQQALADMGVDKKNIKTADFEIYPQYDYDKQPEVIVGYRVYNSLNVTVLNVDKLGEIISSALAAGANQADNVVYEMGDTSDLYDDALVAAMDDAKAKAELLATASGMTISATPVNIKELSTEETPANFANIRMEAAATDSVASGAVPLDPGETEIEARVELVYQLLPAA